MSYHEKKRKESGHKEHYNSSHISVVADDVLEIGRECARYRYFIVVDIPEEAHGSEDDAKHEDDSFESELLTTHEVLFAVEPDQGEHQADDCSDQ